ncbi:MAG: PEP-CTERM sorting domain-containing protein [Methylomonas sp.]|nr:MAG: PEP-CTERM sorting domain-containing protein [Methylomonas sp.]
MQFEDKNVLLVASLLLSLTTLNAEASLTPYTSDGKAVVYSSVSNITWTADANLLGTMISNQGFNSVVNAIIAASPVIYDTPNFYDGSYNNYASYSGQYSLSVNDFNSIGQTNWFGAQGFVGYLNSIHYGGSSLWVLPSAGANLLDDYNNYGQLYYYGGQFGELYYYELGGTTSGNIPNTTTFSNERVYAYWLATEYTPNPFHAWNFDTYNGNQNDVSKVTQFFAWAVSPGRVAAVPLPSAAWLFGSGLIGFMGASLKRKLR